MRFIELPMAQYLLLMWNFSSCAPYVLFRQVGSSPEARDAFQVVESTLVLRCALVCPVLCVQQRPLCYTPPCLGVPAQAWFMLHQSVQCYTYPRPLVSVTLRALV